ncbi:MAG: M23 family metallopeptidase, partial [Desulfobacterales bacterium]|nr:M23 family metallopeptidase [Desulfobacterales bacterium]
MKKAVIILILVGIFVPLTWVVLYKYEGTSPEVEISLPSEYLKKSYEMALTVRDGGTGLRRVMVSLMQNGNEKVLMDKDYPPSSILSFFSDQKVTEESFSIPVESRRYGMNDGDATIRILVLDYSWHGWNKGNRFYEEKKVVIDTKPPQIKVLTKQHNVSKGGSGLVIYKVFETDTQSGVMVGDNFFPGHSGMFDDPSIYAGFFALNHTQGPGTQIFVQAQDPAGNISKRGFHHYIKDKNFRTDVLNISDRFLDRKMPDIDLGEKADAFAGATNPMLGKFLHVNKELRRQNVEKVLAVPSDTVNQVLWEGRFGRLAGAANRAKFADRRIYKYKGKEIDRAVHLGVDLASTSNAEVGAANNGRVIMADSVGIFGNTVILDHGFGLASLYSHLSH